MSYPVFEFVEPKPRALERKALTVASVLMALAAVVFISLNIAHQHAAEPVTTLISKLQPNADWVSNGEVVANGKFCTGYPVPCDSISRSYHSETAVTSEGMRKIVAESGLPLMVANTCGSAPLQSVGIGSARECIATGVVNGYDVTIRATQSSENDPATEVNFSVSSVDNRWK